MDHVDVAGTRIAYRRRGDGPPILLLHGGLCDSRVWSGAIDAFADEFTVVAWDAPGCGGSSDPPAHFRMPDFAQCLSGFIRALDLAPAHVLGHSWGATLALELHRQRPRAVRTLLLVGAYAGWAGSLPPAEVERRLAYALEVADRGPGGFDPASVHGIFSEAMPADRAAQLAAVMSETRPTGTRAMARAMAEADLRGALARIGVATLLLYGEHDERAGRAVAEALHAAIPGSTLEFLQGLGHECYLEDADAFHAEVRKYLRSTAGK
jgi:pimeloyl-ACP methyl ester carboxylesterase